MSTHNTAKTKCFKLINTRMMLSSFERDTYVNWATVVRVRTSNFIGLVVWRLVFAFHLLYWFSAHVRHAWRQHHKFVYINRLKQVQIELWANCFSALPRFWHTLYIHTILPLHSDADRQPWARARVEFYEIICKSVIWDLYRLRLPRSNLLRTFWQVFFFCIRWPKIKWGKYLGGRLP